MRCGVTWVWLLGSVTASVALQLQSNQQLQQEPEDVLDIERLDKDLAELMDKDASPSYLELSEKDLADRVDKDISEQVLSDKNLADLIDKDFSTSETTCDFDGPLLTVRGPKQTQQHLPQVVKTRNSTPVGIFTEIVEGVKRRAFSMSPMYRKSYAFEARHQCKDEPTITAAFAELDKMNGGKITPEHVEENFQNDLVRLRFTLQDGRLSYDVRSGDGHHGWSTEQVVKDRAPAYHRLISELLEEVELPDMQFAVSLSDRNDAGNAAILKTEGTPGKDLLVVPRSLADWGEQARSLLAESIRSPCSSTKTQAVFRGATTGGRRLKWNASVPTNLLTYHGQPIPRYEVAALSKQRPDLLDAGFTNVVQADEPALFKEELEKRGMLRGWLSDDEQRCYAGVVVMDGNSLPDRLPKQLAYGIPVVFVHNKSDEFWYNELRAGFDYIPATTSTLTAVLEKLQARPDLAKCIGKNGRRFVAEHLSKSRLQCYMYKMLSEYAKRYQPAAAK